MNDDGAAFDVEWWPREQEPNTQRHVEKDRPTVECKSILNGSGYCGICKNVRTIIVICWEIFAISHGLCRGSWKQQKVHIKKVKICTSLQCIGNSVEVKPTTIEVTRDQEIKLKTTILLRKVKNTNSIFNEWPCYGWHNNRLLISIPTNHLKKRRIFFFMKFYLMWVFFIDVVFDKYDICKRTYMNFR